MAHNHSYKDSHYYYEHYFVIIIFNLFISSNQANVKEFYDGIIIILLKNYYYDQTLVLDEDWKMNMGLWMNLWWILVNVIYIDDYQPYLMLNPTIKMIMDFSSFYFSSFFSLQEQTGVVVWHFLIFIVKVLVDYNFDWLL